jgi:outer membrane protein OmpA-like peptidoglycan-associated protein
MAEDWLADVRKYAGDADEGVVGAIVKYCGIALQSRDSSLVAMSDKKERELVRESYLKKKLGLTNSDAELDEAVIAVGQVMKADRTKNRVTVYYLLAEHFGLLGMFGAAVGASVAGAGGAAGAAALAGGAVGLAAMAPTVAIASSTDEAAASPPHIGQKNTPDDVNIIGWGCGIAALVLGAIILAALLAWYADRPSVAPAPAPVAPVTTAAPAVTAPVAVEVPAVPQGSGVIAGEVNGRPKLTVYFDTGKSAVTNELAAAATALKEYMAKNPAAKIAVSGYNDPTGNAARNAELSKNRAQAVAKALEAAGVPAAAINLEKPAASTDTDVSAAEARRVEVVVKP